MLEEKYINLLDSTELLLIDENGEDCTLNKVHVLKNLNNNECFLLCLSENKEYIDKKIYVYEVDDDINVEENLKYSDIYKELDRFEIKYVKDVPETIIIEKKLKKQAKLLFKEVRRGFLDEEKEEKFNANNQVYYANQYCFTNYTHNFATIDDLFNFYFQKYLITQYRHSILIFSAPEILAFLKQKIGIELTDAEKYDFEYFNYRIENADEILRTVASELYK